MCFRNLIAALMCLAICHQPTEVVWARGGFRGGGGGGGARASRPAPRPAPRPSSRPATRPVSRPSTNRPTTLPSTRPGGGGAGHHVTLPSGGSHTGPRGGTITGGSTGIHSHEGPAGGTFYHGARGGTYTGPRGNEIAGGGRGGAYVGPNGTVMGGGQRGVAGQGPGGGSFAAGGQGGFASGPGGRTVAGGSRAGVGVGPNGGIAAGGSRGGIAMGPGGAIAGGSRGGFAAGPGGRAIAGGARGGVALGPYGGAGRGVRGGAAGYVGHGTFHMTGGYLHGRAVAVNRGFFHYGCFNRAWFATYPGAWYPGRWAVRTGVWTAATWATAAAFCGIAAAPVSYDYGSSIVYQDDQVYQDGQPIATQTEYAQQATDLADQGRAADPPPEDEWQPLGVFALVQGEESTANDLFQLAINQGGIVRGNYYNALSETNLPVYGSLDPKTQRIAWSIGDKQDIVYEAGLNNLTQEATPCLVHFGTDKTQQMTLVRIEQPADQAPESEAAPTQG